MIGCVPSLLPFHRQGPELSAVVDSSRLNSPPSLTRAVARATAFDEQQNGQIDRRLFSFYLTRNVRKQGSVLILGGYNTSYAKEEFNFVPLIDDSFWAVGLLSVGFSARHKAVCVTCASFRGSAAAQPGWPAYVVADVLGGACGTTGGCEP